MPAVILAAIAGSRPWFIILLAISIATDALDGFLARRLNAHSELGRTLDSFADYVMLLSGAAGIALLWPEIMKRELPWVISGLAAFFGVLVFGYARFGRALRYHTWGAKLLGPALAASMIPLLGEWSATPFHVVVVLQIVSALEQLIIAVMLPSHGGEIPTVWHAWQLRRESMALLKPRRHHLRRRRGPRG